MDVGQMSAEQVARELSEIDGAFGALDGLYTREGLLEREAALRGRQMIVGVPLRGVSLDLALAGLVIPEGLSVHLTGRDDVAFVAGLPDVAAILRDYDGVSWLHITAKRGVFHAVTACCIAAEAPPEALALLPEEAP